MVRKTKWFKNDIQIGLTPGLPGLLETWLPKYLTARRNHFGQPFIQDGQLNIGAPDSIDFVSFLEASEFPELELKRFKTLLHQQLSEKIAQKSAAIEEGYYQRTLEFLEGLSKR